MGNLVQEWIDNGKDYHSGVLLFSKLSNNKKMVSLFNRNSNEYNKGKLEHELLKFLNDPNLSLDKIASDNTESKPEKKNLLQKTKKLFSKIFFANMKASKRN